MTSDEKRREVAEKLRVYSHDFDFGDSNPFWYVSKAAFGDVDIRPYYSVFARLADLIDRPTCETIEHGGPDESHVCKSCSMCSYGWFEDIHDKPYSYCPNCGAKVVSADD